jgi:Phosphotransferase enzyme family
MNIHDPFGLPDDPEVGAFAAVLDPAIMQPHLERILKTPCALTAIRVTRLKPKRRAVLEYEVLVDGQQQSLIGKLRAKGADRQTFVLQRNLWNARFSTQNTFVPEPLGLIPELHLMLCQKVKGTGFNQLLENTEAVPHARRVARAIHQLHSLEHIRPARTHTLEGELQILRERLHRVATARPEWKARLERVMLSCDRLASSLPRVQSQLIHRDFYADQVIITNSGACLIDLDLCSLGDPALDIGNFLAHLTEHSLRRHGNPNHLRRLEIAFEHSYLELAPDVSRESMFTYSTLTLARHISLSLELPGRQHTTAALLSLVESRLSNSSAIINHPSEAATWA